MDIICNSSPIIGLSAINRLNLLWLLFDRVIIPNEVYSEVENAKTNKIGMEELKQAVEEKHIEIYHIKNNELVNQLYGRLHTGELEVIVSAKELKISHVIIDDRSARIMANSMCLKTLGIMGILLIAKEKGYIPEVKKEIDCLIKNGYRISLKLYHEVLKKAGEFDY